VLSHKGPVVAATFDPTGKRVVTASEDGTAQVWDARTGDSLTTLSHGGLRVFSAVFSGDGQLVLTSAEDGTARIWDASRKQQALLVLAGHTGSARDATFSHDDKQIATAGQDRTARIYRCEICGSVRELLTLADRLLRTA
jgi:WD40 repeat protein